jgi:hypothetical protein
MLVERFDASGTVTWPRQTGGKGESYRVTVDYINADTINMPVWISKTLAPKSGTVRHYVNPSIPPGDEYKPESEEYRITRVVPPKD